MAYSIQAGSPLWEAIKADDLQKVQALTTEIVKFDINVFSVEVAIAAPGGFAMVNVLGLACDLLAVESSVWLYRQVPDFLPKECFEMSTKGFLSIFERPGDASPLHEIARRCLVLTFTHFHECRLRFEAPIKTFSGGPKAAALFLNIGLQLQADHDQKSLSDATPVGRFQPRKAGRSARL